MSQRTATCSAASSTAKSGKIHRSGRGRRAPQAAARPDGSRRERRALTRLVRKGPGVFDEEDPTAEALAEAALDNLALDEESRELEL